MELIVRVLQSLLLLLGMGNAPNTPADPCGFARAYSFNSYDHALGTHLALREVSAADRAALLRFDGIYDWVGYERGGFDRPELEADPIEIVVILDNSEMRYVYLYDDLDPTTDIQWVWAFRSLKASTDANGEHFGLHDICASGGWSYADVRPLLTTELLP